MATRAVAFMAKHCQGKYKAPRTEGQEELISNKMNICHQIVSILDTECLPSLPSIMIFVIKWTLPAFFLKFP